MLIAPLKVFASIRQRPTQTPQYTQKLVVKRQPSSSPTLIVQNTTNDYNTNGTIESEAQFVYSDCQPTTSDIPLYTEQLEQLVNTTMKGYDSAGVFINSRGATFNTMRTNMMKSAINLLRHQLAKENDRRLRIGQSAITLKYGHIGFCDDCCVDYHSNRMTSNDDAMKISLSTMVGPIHSIDNVFDSIISMPCRQPSLLIFHLSDGDQFDSTFAWIDLHPPITRFDQDLYGKSYTEFESLTKLWSIQNHPGAVNICKYSMSHLLIDFFSGSYQAVVFAHFEEYGPYTPELDLNLLVYASQLQNIRCCVTWGRRSNLQGVVVNNVKNYRVRELQHQIDKLNLLVEEYKSSCVEDRQEISRLHGLRQGEIDSYDYLRERLIIMKNVAHAAMERQKATTNVQLADMSHQINDIRIELVKANMVTTSLQHTVRDYEIYVKELETANEELCRHMKEPEVRNKILMTQQKQQSYDGDLTNASEHYIQEIHELKSKMNRLNREYDVLVLERKQQASENASIRLEMDTKISRLERLHDMEKKSLAAEKDREIAMLKDDLEFIRSQVGDVLEASTAQQQRTQTTTPPPPPPQLKVEPKTSPSAAINTPPFESSLSQYQTQTQPPPSDAIVYIDLSSSPSPSPELKPSLPTKLAPESATSAQSLAVSATTPPEAPSHQISLQQQIPNNKRRRLDQVEMHNLD